jgi:hypothetical protein
MTKGAPILQTAVRSKLRFELSYRDVFLPGKLIPAEGASDCESQEQPGSQGSEWNVGAVFQPWSSIR